MRAGIYARYSSELQNDRSVDDQIALCEDFARRSGYTVAGHYADRAMSGTTIHGRDGLARLLHDARAGAFDVVVVEALDRLSRDTEDLAGIHKRLTFAGIDIVAVHDGRADVLQVGIRGLVSTLFINDLRHKTRRGLAAVVKDGRHAGGRAYGYRAVPGEPGRLRIVTEEADVVRRIFRDYLDGVTPRDIAGRLNAEGIAPPRGAKWNASTINGNTKRGHGLLQNALYSGHIVWNKTRAVRDPDTGKRIYRPNPESEWQRAHAPELAIVAEDLWQAAQDEKRVRGHNGPGTFRKRKRLLSGLIRCSECGGGMTMHDKRGAAIRIKCSRHRESGSCGNGRSYRLDHIERAVIDGILDKLRNPAALTAHVEALQSDRRSAARTRASAERAVATAKGKIDRLNRALISGRIDEAFFDAEIVDLRAELANASAALEEAPAAKVVTLHPASMRRLESLLAVLSEHLPSIDPEADADMFNAFRSLIDHVVIHDRPDGRIDCEVVGHLSAMVGEDAGDAWGVEMVARGGLEPPTP
ncbi:recombinase family protein [Defluviimonas sp. SAOS-178_SWC]|uniref:recombinase family protein n=1 Tax=Defluviimonas sp. SAOS-178_SWC TaxID=3121287 RepID=UPI0032220881